MISYIRYKNEIYNKKNKYKFNYKHYNRYNLMNKHNIKLQNRKNINNIRLLGPYHISLLISLDTIHNSTIIEKSYYIIINKRNL